MRITSFLLVLIAFDVVVSSDVVAAANCRIPRFKFNISSEGPWPARMRVAAGGSCGSHNWSFGATAPGKLYLVKQPAHGAVTLSYPATYRYFPAGGYVGGDSFTLRVCGTKNGGYQGCANILFAVTVMAGTN